MIVLYILKIAMNLSTQIHMLNRVNSNKTYDFKDLFHNIQISDLHRVINSFYIEYPAAFGNVSRELRPPPLLAT